MHARLRRPAVALITTTLAASVLGIAPAAHAADGTISGTVSGTTGPLGGVVVELYQFDDVYDSWEQLYGPGTMAYTEPDGSYEIVVPPGDYRVQFSDTNQVYAFEYYVDADLVEDGQTVTVPDSGTVDVDATLEPAASVSGRVLGTGDAGVQDIAVWAIQKVVQDDGYVDYRFVGVTSTDENGDYTFGGLPGGSYLFQYEDGTFDESPGIYANEYYDNQSNIFEADPFVLDDAEVVTGFDVQLELDAEISGVVTGVDGAALDYAYVSALVEVGDRWRAVAYGDVNDAGEYVIDGLAAGTYRVEFGGETNGRYLEEYWDNVGDVSTADDVVLGVDGSKTNVDAELVEGEHDPVYPTVENLTAPVVSGTPQVGSPLTSSAGTWSPNPTLVEYYWVAGNELLQEGTSPTYVPTAADVGKTISVYVFASADGYDYGFAQAFASGPVAAAPAPPVVTPPVVAPPVVTPPAPAVDVPAGLAAVLEGVGTSGKPKVGTTIKVTGLDKLFRASTAVSYKFQWFAGKKAIKKATKSKLKITRAMKGKVLSVKVTAKASSTSRSVKLKVGKVK